MSDANKSLVKKYKNNMSMFDFIKGVAIFAVVLFHSVGLWQEDISTAQACLLIFMIGPFWMSVFFMASGYWFGVKDVKEYTKKRFLAFLKDYVMVGIVTTFCYATIHYIRFHSVRSAIKGSMGVVLAFLTGSRDATTIGSLEIYDIGPIWFIMALCWGDILLNCVLHIKRERLVRPIVVLLAILGIVIGYNRWLPFCIASALFCVLSLYVGNEMRKTKYLIKKWEKTHYILAVVLYMIGLALVLCFLTLFKLKTYGLEMVAGILAGIGLLRLGLMLGSKKNRIVDFFKKLGRYTYWILMVHTVEMLSIDWRLLKNFEWISKYPVLGLVTVLLLRWSIIGIGCLIISNAGRVLARRKQNELTE